MRTISLTRWLGIVLLAMAVRLDAVPFQLAAGGTHSLALASDGRVYQWGEWGGLTPGVVFGVENVTAIAAGERHALALRSDGTVWAWGDNSHGQLGNGSVISRDRPQQVAGLSGITAIACGAYHSYALRQDGTIVAWGDNSNGQLGDGSKTDRRSPVPVENFSGIQAIAAGTSHLLVLRKDGTVCSWGLADDAPAATSKNMSDSGKPVPLCLSEFSGVRAIAAGGHAGYALRDDGTVWSWGTPPCGGGGAFSTLLTRRPMLDRVEKISASAFHVFMLRNDETVWSCAYASDTTGVLESAQVQELRDLSQIEAIAAGTHHGLARSRNGVLRAWGDNTYGQLGTGDRLPSRTGTVWDGTGELTKP